MQSWTTERESQERRMEAGVGNTIGATKVWFGRRTAAHTDQVDGSLKHALSILGKQKTHITNIRYQIFNYSSRQICIESILLNFNSIDSIHICLDE